MTVGPIEYQFKDFLPAYEEEILIHINDERTRQGLVPFVMNPGLRDLARRLLLEGEGVRPLEKEFYAFQADNKIEPRETFLWLNQNADRFLAVREDGQALFTEIGIACYHDFELPEPNPNPFLSPTTPPYLKWYFIEAEGPAESD